MANEVLHTWDHKRYDGRAFLRLELTDDAVIVVVHELGPWHVREPTDESGERWQTWQRQLEPPVLTDDQGTAYVLAPKRRARGSGGSPSTAPIPMKATVSWYFRPGPRAEVRSWTIDGRWTVERRRS